jgi:hypothetical protein
MFKVPQAALDAAGAAAEESATLAPPHAESANATTAEMANTRPLRRSTIPSPPSGDTAAVCAGGEIAA